MDRMDTFLELYGESLSPELARLREEAEGAGVPIIRPQMQSLLRFWIRTEKPKRVLEIGTAVGFSSLLMAEAAGTESIRIETIEKDERRLAQAREHFRAFGYAEPNPAGGADDSARAGRSSAGASISLLAGDAAEILPALPAGEYDLAFLDAAKGQYPNFLPEVVRLLAPGGALLADNLFQGGDILESRYAVRRRDRTIHERMREFLYAITRDPALETCILPIADGVAICVKK